MVFFVCGACGGSFKRKQADQHTFRCRNWAFSCMDCHKDFPGQSYVQHTQCITESEKYFGNHHVAKVGKDKNEVWMNKLRDRLSSQTGLKPYIAGLVTRMLGYPNIPRKQTKFENFLKTSMNMSYKPTVNELWRLVSEAGEDSNKENSTTNGVDSTSNGVDSTSNGVDSTSNGVDSTSNGVDSTTNGVDSTATSQQSAKEEEEQNVEGQPDADTKQKKKKKRKLEKSVEEEEELEETTESPKKKKKKQKIATLKEVLAAVTCEEEESDESVVKESKSAKRRRRKQQQSATEEPDPLAPIRRGMGSDSAEKEMDFADYEDISVDTVVGEKNFKWRRTLKKLIREGPPEGIKVAKLLTKVEQLHNNPLEGASQPLPKDTLQTILAKMLARKPFSIVNGKATLGKSS